jgi:hypothetical protein
MFPNGSNATPKDEVSSSRSRSRLNGSVDTEVSQFPSARRSDANVIGADGGTSQSNRPDAMLLGPDALLQILIKEVGCCSQSGRISSPSGRLLLNFEFL